MHRAQQTLGPADSDSRTHAEVVIEAGDFGTVRIFFEQKPPATTRATTTIDGLPGRAGHPDTAHADADHA